MRDDPKCPSSAGKSQTPRCGIEVYFPLFPFPPAFTGAVGPTVRNKAHSPFRPRMVSIQVPRGYVGIPSVLRPDHASFGYGPGFDVSNTPGQVRSESPTSELLDNIPDHHSGDWSRLSYNIVQAPRTGRQHQRGIVGEYVQNRSSADTWVRRLLETRNRAMRTTPYNSDDIGRIPSDLVGHAQVPSENVGEAVVDSFRIRKFQSGTLLTVWYAAGREEVARVVIFY